MPLRSLHFLWTPCKLDMSEVPPLDRGIRWSATMPDLLVNGSPQMAHGKPRPQVMSLIVLALLRYGLS